MYEEKLASNSTKEKSPFENLNDRFEKLNRDLGDWVSKLESAGHKLSDTNFPSPENPNKEIIPETPFREGHLMRYFIQLNQMEKHLYRLTDEVQKLNGLL